MKKALKNALKGPFFCSQCGANAAVEIKNKYLAKELGLGSVTIDNMPIIHCETCGNDDPLYFDMEGMLRAIARKLADKPAALSGKEFRFLRKHLGLSPIRLAETFGTTRETVSRWENDQREVPETTDRLIRSLVLMEGHERDGILAMFGAIRKDPVSEAIHFDAMDLCEAS
jgi:putative transcriptional regulator